MPTGIKEGIGADVTFGTSAITTNFLDISLDGISVEDIDTSDQSTTDTKTYIASTLKEGGTVTIKLNTNGYDLLDLHDAVGVMQTVTVRPPKVVSTDTTRPSWAFSGYIKSYSAVVGAIGSLQTQNVVVKVAGTVTTTNGAV